MTRRALVVLGAVLLLLPRVSGAQGDGALPPSVPPLTDEDRRAAFPDVQVVPLTENRGYAGNNNVGIRAALDSGLIHENQAALLVTIATP